MKLIFRENNFQKCIFWESNFENEFSIFSKFILLLSFIGGLENLKRPY